MSNAFLGCIGMLQQSYHLKSPNETNSAPCSVEAKDCEKSSVHKSHLISVLQTRGSFPVGMRGACRRGDAVLKCTQVSSVGGRWSHYQFVKKQKTHTHTHTTFLILKAKSVHQKKKQISCVISNLLYIFDLHKNSLAISQVRCELL